MSTKRIIIGDKEVSIPVLGIFPMIGIGLVLWLLSGTYVVGPDEVGVVQTFGKHSRIAQSGLNYHLPFPIETVQTPKVTEVKRVEIGFRSTGNNQYRTIEKESLMLLEMKISLMLNSLCNIRLKIQWPIHSILLNLNSP